MLLCAVLLYARTPGDFFTAPQQSAAIVHGLARLANNLVNGGAAFVTRVSAGAGLWLATAASLVLAQDDSQVDASDGDGDAS